MHFYLYALMAALLATLPFCAQATSSTSTVAGPQVAKGVANIEARIGYDVSRTGEERLSVRQHFDYAFTDSYAFRIITHQQRLQHDAFEYNATAMEHRIQLFDKDQHGWDGGIRLIYQKPENSKAADSLSFFFMSEADLSDEWLWRHNTILTHDIGGHSQSGLQLALRNRLARNFKPKKLDPLHNLQTGIEFYHEFGRVNDSNSYSEQNHQIGVFLTGTFENDAFFMAALRNGISSNSADNIFKLTIGQNF